jgi:hypothetical protein
MLLTLQLKIEILQCSQVGYRKQWSHLQLYGFTFHLLLMEIYTAHLFLCFCTVSYFLNNGRLQSLNCNINEKLLWGLTNTSWLVLQTYLNIKNNIFMYFLHCANILAICKYNLEVSHWRKGAVFELMAVRS